MQAPFRGGTLQQLGDGRWPSRVVCVDTETRIVPRGETGYPQEHHFRLGCASCTEFKKGVPGKQVWLDFTDPAEFFSWLMERTKRKTASWVFAHNLGFDLTVLRFWQWMEDTYGSPRIAITSDPPTIIHLSDGQKGLLFLDSLNYFRSSLADLGKSVGLAKGNLPPQDASAGLLADYCRRDVEILTRSILGLFAFLRTRGLGAPGYTAAACAFNAYRRRFMLSRVRIHDVPSAIALEREAFFGGRCECFFVGEIKSPVYVLDINSLYPYAMKEFRYPCNLLEVRHNGTVEELRAALREGEAVARVTLSTGGEEFPVRSDRGLIFARGDFSTTLAGNELRRAVEGGAIKRVHSVAIYETADLFSAYVNYFYSLRAQYRSEGDFAYDHFCKLILNSLAGKWAQRGSEWIDMPDEGPPRRWGQFMWLNTKTNTYNLCRSIAGLVQLKVERGETTFSFPAIAACINANARELMRGFRQLAGLRECYYMDTDSLHTSEVGYQRILQAGLISDQAIGRFKRVRDGIGAVYRNLKDYTVGVYVVQSGVRREAIKIAEERVSQEHWPKLPVVLSQPPSSFYQVTLLQRSVHSKYLKGVILSDGFTDPFTLHEEGLSSEKPGACEMPDMQEAEMGVGLRSRKKGRDWESAYRLLGLPVPSEITLEERVKEEGDRRDWYSARS